MCSRDFVEKGAKYGAIIGIIAVIIGIGITASILTPGDDSMDTTPVGIVDDNMDTTPVMSGGDDNNDNNEAVMPDNETTQITEVNVGVLVPITGDLSSYGFDNKIGYEMALEDLNSHLSQKDADWRMKLVIEDTQTDPIIALEKTQSLDSKGIKYILGPASSAEIRNMMAYANSNDILILSPSSTSPKLAIPNDNIYRFVSDDSRQGGVIASLLEQSGIKVMVTVYRGDIWGDGMYENTKREFEQKGGIVTEPIRYSPEVTIFSTETDVLSGIVDDLLKEYDASEIAIFLVSFDEGALLFNSASQYESLRAVQWIGSEGLTASFAVIDNKQASNFATDVNLLSIQFSAADNPIYHKASERYKEMVGDVPGNNYMYASYDSLWVLGLAMDEVGFESQDINMQLPQATMQYVGALGNITLNAAGDLDIANYEFLTIKNDKWIPSIKYDAETDTISVIGQ